MWAAEPRFRSSVAQNTVDPAALFSDDPRGALLDLVSTRNGEEGFGPFPQRSPGERLITPAGLTLVALAAYLAADTIHTLVVGQAAQPARTGPWSTNFAIANVSN